MNVDNVKSQMRKGMLEYCILLLLHREPSYASDIIQNLKEAKLIVVEGTLYPLLTRLKNDDLLSYEWVESTHRTVLQCGFPYHVQSRRLLLPCGNDSGDYSDNYRAGYRHLHQYDIQCLPN